MFSYHFYFLYSIIFSMAPYDIRSSIRGETISVLVIKIPWPATHDKPTRPLSQVLSHRINDKAVTRAKVVVAVAAAACHRISVGEQTTEASRDRKAAGISIYIRCV